MGIIALIAIVTGFLTYLFLFSETGFLNSTNPSFLRILIIGITVFLIVIVVLIIFIVGIRFILYSKLKLSSKRTVNTLSILENDLGRQFRYLELDYMSLNPVLFKKIQDLPENSSTDNINKAVRKLWECKEINKSFNINQKLYKKVIIIPLIMDFNYRNYDRDFKKDIHYFLRPRKMVVDQTLDLFK